jgi:hypothetical protein
MLNVDVGFFLLPCEKAAARALIVPVEQRRRIDDDVGYSVSYLAASISQRRQPSTVCSVALDDSRAE